MFFLGKNNLLNSQAQDKLLQRFSFPSERHIRPISTDNICYH